MPTRHRDKEVNIGGRFQEKKHALQRTYQGQEAIASYPIKSVAAHLQERQHHTQDA